MQERSGYLQRKKKCVSPMRRKLRKKQLKKLFIYRKKNNRNKHLFKRNNARNTVPYQPRIGK